MPHPHPAFGHLLPHREKEWGANAARVRFLAVAKKESADRIQRLAEGYLSVERNSSLVLNLAKACLIVSIASIGFMSVIVRRSLWIASRC